MARRSFRRRGGFRKRRRISRRSIKRAFRAVRRIKRGVITAPSKFLNPPTAFVKMYFSHNGTVSDGTSYYKEVLFRGNDVMNPGDITVSGIATGVTQWMNFYEHFRVTACKITVIMFKETTPTENIAVYLWAADNNLATDPAIFVPEEQPQVTKRYIPSNNSGIPMIKMSKYVKTKTIFGKKPLDDTYSGQLSIGPVQKWWWHMMVMNLNPAVTNVPARRYIVRLKYYCKLHDRLDLFSR